MLNEDDLYDPALSAVGRGQVQRKDGKPMRTYEVIRRRWGWPSRAARMVDDWLFEHGEDVQLHDEGRVEQQLRLIQNVPGLFDSLMNALARGATREEPEFGRRYDRVEIRFGEDVFDEGLTTRLVYALAERFGGNFDEMQKQLSFQTGPLGERIIHVPKGVDDANEL